MEYDKEYIQFMKTVGEKIHKLRVDRNLSIKEIADKTGISKSYLYNLEKGKTLGTTIDKFIIISEFLETELSEIF